jgi:hypothetical protein
LDLFSTGDRDVSFFCISGSSLGTIQLPIKWLKVSFLWSKEGQVVKLIEADEGSKLVDLYLYPQYDFKGCRRTTLPLALSFQQNHSLFSLTLNNHYTNLFALFITFQKMKGDSLTTLA